MRAIALCTLAACALAPAIVSAQPQQPPPPQLAPADTSATAGDSAQRLPRVVVTGEAEGAGSYAPRRTRSATRTDAPLRDVPQAVTVLSRQLIADQAMQSMADAVRYIPGVTMGLGEGHRDAPTIRGNSSTADFYVDGVRDDAQYLRDLYNVERVEAIKGSNAMIFGRGGGGGVLNRVTKVADWTPIRSITVEGGSFDHKRTTLDVGEGLGRAVAGRVNGVMEHSRSFRDGASLEREGVSPSLAVVAGGTVVRLGYEYFADRRTVDRGIPAFAGRPAGGVGIETFFGDERLNRSRSTVHAGDLTVERGAAAGLLLRNRTRVVSYDKFYQNIFPGAVNAAGSAVSLSAYNNATGRTNVFNQTDLSRAFFTSALRHTLLAGAELGRQGTDNFRETGYFDDSLTSISVPLRRPSVTVPLTFRQAGSDADNRSRALIAAAYVQDQLELGEHWQAVAGVRYDRFDLRFHNDRDGRTLRRRDHMISPRAGLVFKPTEPVSFYGSYSVSHLPSSGDQFSSLSVTTQALQPERFRNQEVGAKWEPTPELSLTAAAFRLDRTNTAAPDPNDATRTVLTGSQRTSGYEAGVAGRVTGSWQVAGGYSWQRATITSRTTAAWAGAAVPLVPRYTASLWNRYQVTRAFGAGLGVVHQAKMFAAVDNMVTLPAFTRVDGAAFVNLGRRLRAQANVENLLDRRYFPTSHGNNNIMPGAPRTVRVSVTVAQ